MKFLKRALVVVLSIILATGVFGAVAGCQKKVAEGVLTIRYFIGGFGEEWLESAAEKFIGLYGPIFVFVLCGFEHSIANMFYLPAGIFLGANVGWGGFLLSNLLPVTLGNIVGGCLVGIVYRAVYLKKKG